MGVFDKIKKKKTTEKREILLQSYSPCCPIEAFVEEDEHTCYFYLWRFPNTPQAAMVSCFVCNTADKENTISMEEWKRNPSGPPMLPYEQVLHSTNGLKLDKDKLEIVWNMEGSGAGLLDNGELIAFIPEWAFSENFSGYGRYIKGETPFGWEMTQAREYFEEVVESGRSFWKKMEGDYWPDFQASQLQSLETFMGKHEKYFAIDGGEFPPRALVTGERNGVHYGITLGMSLLRQPMVESFYHEKTSEFSRVELGFACTKERESDFMTILQRMAGAAPMPWSCITSVGHGHTIKLEGVEGFPAAWLLNANLLEVQNSPKYQEAFGERVNLLWLVPITKEEYDFLLEYDMRRIFELRFPVEMTVFDGKAKVPIEKLKELAARPAERNEIENQSLKEKLAAAAIELLEKGTDYDRQDNCTFEFGYLFDIDDHGLEALFKIITDKGVCYFAAQKSSLLRLNFNEGLFKSTTEGFLELHSQAING